MTDQIAEEATGIRQTSRSIGKLYLSEDCAVSPKQAFAALSNGMSVHVPNAGAGSYRDFFHSVGFKAVKVVDWTSSAGDWCFGVFDGEAWTLAFQENRYPHFGFRYSVNTEQSALTFEELCNMAMS